MWSSLTRWRQLRLCWPEFAPSVNFKEGAAEFQFCLCIGQNISISKSCSSKIITKPSSCNLYQTAETSCFYPGFPLEKLSADYPTDTDRNLNVHTAHKLCWTFSPGPIDGSCGRYGSYSACTKTCGVGTRFRERFCNQPSPARGGRDCAGTNVETQSCARNVCPGKLSSFRWNCCYMFSSVNTGV